ncbi:MAG: helix-turn-helix domain containing protein, partial [Clostridia bacterium]|nr:helix-turn-helix domain containing protein [Clostridia bacterium]
MDSKEAIIKAATELIEERGERLGSVTVREIGKRAGVGLGLVNYHFGNKDELIAQCVEKIINGIVARFVEMRERTEGMLPPEKLESLVQMTLDFLFEHRAVSRISILSDMQS